MKGFSILAGGVLLAVATLPGSATAEIRVGVVGPMSGPYAAFGGQMRRGVEMAVKEINAAGGIDGEKITLAIGDDRCDAGRAVTAADKMAQKKVALVVGHFCSGASIEASRVYARQKIIQISPAATNPVYTEARPGPGVFRIAHSDRQQGEFAAAYIAARFAGKKIAILGDDSIFGASMARAVRRKLEAKGQEPALNETYSASRKDFFPLVAKLKAAGVEVVYIGGYHTEIGLIVREMRKQKVSAQLIASDALATTEFWRIAGRAGEGTLLSFVADPRRNSSAARIVKKFRAAKIEPNGYTLASYTAVKLWADAAKAAGLAQFDKVVERLATIDTETPIGRVRFDSRGDVEEPQLVWYVWHKGRYAPLEQAP